MQRTPAPACTRIGLVIHHGRPAAVAAADRVRTWAAAHGVAVTEVDVWQDQPDRPGLPLPTRRNSAAEVAASGHPDLIVTVGGDGTFLRGARVAAQDGVPVLGVNVGRVGFLTEVEPDDVESALAAFVAGRAQLDERLMLTLRASRPLDIPPGLQSMLCYGRGPLLPPPPQRDTDCPNGVDLDVTAVNDIVFEKLARDRQASLGVFVEDTLFASYSADALIVASPTGSTAYNFAAGGPIVSPRVRALIFTPVAAHMVFNRSLVVAADEPITVRVLDRSGQIAVSIDGQLRGVLEPGDWVSVLPAHRPAHLVRLGPSDFYARLRSRFGLADAPAAVADSAPIVVD
ncbi:NAD(+)/NADH kinase [Jatrophihabitans sp.]|uniref:NAD(+)/NADH kinase n=1 Tax=Jatrophihabitans sp. TaxID=1932789 RepID=UPI002BD18512|nr:NAD(+)/NADH kinase [Jatrophihabitans sp.]